MIQEQDMSKFTKIYRQLERYLQSLFEHKHDWLYFDYGIGGDGKETPFGKSGVSIRRWICVCRQRICKKCKQWEERSREKIDEWHFVEGPTYQPETYKK